MLCSISGNVCDVPCVSIKSGHIYERRLVEKHLKVTGTCPVTKEELTEDDLVDVKLASPAVKPRPASATSIPGMIKQFQNEWDAVMLETYTLKQHLDTVRQELAHALYQHDAACRVIARLVKERDSARKALGEGAGAANGKDEAAMDVEGEETGISADIVAKMQEVAKELSKKRKKSVKKAIASATSRDAIKKYTAKASHPLHSASKPGINCLDIHPTNQDHIVTGGQDGNAILFNKSTGKIVSTLRGHKKKVTDCLFHPTEDVVVTTSADNTANIWSNQEGKYSNTVLSAHTSPVTGCSLHPSGSYLVTASADKTWSFWDIATATCRKQVSHEQVDSGYSRVQFHPDGLIVGLGTQNGVVRIFDVKESKLVASFKGHVGSSVTGLSFSQNGYYLGSSDDNGVVKLWDLRKLDNFETITPSTKSRVNNLAFDGSGSYLGVAGKDLKIYSSKGWDVVQEWSDHKKEVTCVKFGANAKFIASGSKDKTLKIWSA